jgi:hypothetical protein
MSRPHLISHLDAVMLSEAMQRNAKHEARLSNIQLLPPAIPVNPKTSGTIDETSSVLEVAGFFSRDCGIRMTLRDDF